MKCYTYRASTTQPWVWTQQVFYWENEDQHNILCDSTNTGFYERQNYITVTKSECRWTFRGGSWPGGDCRMAPEYQEYLEYSRVSRAHPKVGFSWINHVAFQRLLSGLSTFPPQNCLLILFWFSLFCFTCSLIWKLRFFNSFLLWRENYPGLTEIWSLVSDSQHQHLPFHNQL